MNVIKVIKDNSNPNVDSRINEAMCLAARGIFPIIRIDIDNMHDINRVVKVIDNVNAAPYMYLPENNLALECIGVKTYENISTVSMFYSFGTICNNCKNLEAHYFSNLLHALDSEFSDGIGINVSITTLREAHINRATMERDLSNDSTSRTVYLDKVMFTSNAWNELLLAIFGPEHQDMEIESLNIQINPLIEIGVKAKYVFEGDPIPDDEKNIDNNTCTDTDVNKKPISHSDEKCDNNKNIDDTKVDNTTPSDNKNKKEDNIDEDDPFIGLLKALGFRCKDIYTEDKDEEVKRTIKITITNIFSCIPVDEFLSNINLRGCSVSDNTNVNNGKFHREITIRDVPDHIMRKITNTMDHYLPGVSFIVED